jgi:REP element-mobilizing transposase RayT
MHPNSAGVLVGVAWKYVPQRFASVELDAYVVMPNHFHGILLLGTDPDHDPPSLSAIIQAFKSETTIQYGRGVKAGLYPRYHRALWHRSYHDRVLRDERILGLARDYVTDNPRKWEVGHAQFGETTGGDKLRNRT